jgi:hypothetical protein
MDAASVPLTRALFDDGPPVSIRGQRATILTLPLDEVVTANEKRPSISLPAGPAKVDPASSTSVSGAPLVRQRDRRQPDLAGSETA